MTDKSANKERKKASDDSRKLDTIEKRKAAKRKMAKTSSSSTDKDETKSKRPKKHN